MANITSSGGFKPSTTDTPLDIRTRVNTYEEIKNIPNPYIGMEILVLTDENNEGRKTKYKVESLKSNDLGLENTLIDINTLKKIETYEVNLEELINLSKEDIDGFLLNPLPYTVQLLQVPKIAPLEVGEYILRVGNEEIVYNNTIPNNKTISFNGVNVVVKLYTNRDENNMPSENYSCFYFEKGISTETSTDLYLYKSNTLYINEDAIPKKYISEDKTQKLINKSFNKLKETIDNIQNSGEGLTFEQAQQLQTAYEHSQSPHINTTDVNNAVSTYVTKHKAELKGDKGDKGETGDKGDTGANGRDGANAVNPNFSIGTVTTLDAGSQATVGLIGTYPNLNLNFGIPRGADGVSGEGTDTNIFKGKVANFLGDSQTEVNGHKTKIYHDWVKEILGLSKVNNYGISGTTITKKNTSDNTAMCVRYANMDNNADLICVMGGVNDRWFNCQLGKFGDTDPITFYGAMETLCDGLLTKYPGKTIIFITPTEQNNNGCNSANTTGYTPTDFANAMKKVCAKYSIPVFDANTCSGIYPLNEANATLYTTDKLHLNNKGHEVLGNKLSKFILNGANVVVVNNDSGGNGGGGSTSETYGNIVISKSSITINEGSSDTFTVKLDKAPTNSQTVSVSSNNSDVTLSTNTLTFNNSNYSTPQTITINVAEDSDTVNDNCTLTLSSNNVSSKTITITITDNDSASGEPDVPSENQFIGKTVSVTKNFEGNFAHLTALLNVDEDMRSNSTYNIVLNGSNATNMSNASNKGGTLFSDNSGDVSNASYVNEVGSERIFTQTVSNGNLTITVPARSGAVSTNYVKVPIIISGSIPYSFQIDEIKVIVNDVERNILKLGSFFASDKEIITIE